jgi:fructokinase
MNEPPRVVGLGEILWDILPDGRRHLGGAPLNAAVHARALGCMASVVSAVGDDELGREAIRRVTERHGLDVSAIAILSDRPTGAVDVRLRDGQPTYEFRAEVAWDFLEATEAARRVLQAADAVIFGTLAQRSAASRRAIHELLALASPACSPVFDVNRRRPPPEPGGNPSCLRVFDVNLRPPFYDDTILRESLALTDVLKLNDDELPIVLAAMRLPAEPDWATHLMNELPRLGTLALTRGARGSTLFSRERPAGHTLPARPVTVQDSVGAGDAFTAALIAGLLKGWALEAIHERAVAAAAFVCSQPGATPPLPQELAVT